MKKVVLLAIMAVCVSISGFAQYFIATPDGLMDLNDQSKNYLVINFEGKSASELYTLTNNYIQKNYVNPKNVLKGDIKDEFLSISTYAENFLMLQKALGADVYANVNFLSQFSFKDGKVKVQISDFKLTLDKDRNFKAFNYVGGSLLDWCIFNTNGNPKKKDLPEKFQNYFNNYVESYIKFVKDYESSNNDW